MDGDRFEGHVRPKRSLPPRNQKKNGLRKPDARTEDMIRFVRELQNQRQPAVFKIQKKAVLPAIGEKNALEPLFSDGTAPIPGIKCYDDYSDSEEDLAANIHIFEHKSVRKAYRDSGLNSVSMNFLPREKSIYKDKQNLGGSLNGLPLRKGRHRRQNKQLPPLCSNEIIDRPSAPSPSERDFLPCRPAAPFPSHTPPLPDESTDDESPIDYIDTF